MGFFKNFLIDKFPHYYREFDTYKNSNGEGIFMRFLGISGDEIDEEVTPLIHKSINQKIAYSRSNEHVNTDLLTYLNKDLGDVFRLILSETDYRKLLANITDIYKLKGTVRGYEKLFFFFGYTVTGFEEIPYISYIYDQHDESPLEDILYDSDIGGEPIIYDHACRNCIQYNLELTQFTSGTGYFTTYPNMVQEVVKLVEPLWAELSTVEIHTVTVGITSLDGFQLTSYDGVDLYALDQ